MNQKGIMAASAAMPEGELADSVMNIRLATEYPGDHVHSVVENGALTFDKDYVHWFNEHQQLINDLRTASNSPMEDNYLHIVVEGVTAHYDELFRLKSKGTKADVFHMLFGMWKTPAERCFMWLGGFRPSELLKMLRNQHEAFTEQQLMELYNLRQSSMMAEHALSQGMDALQGVLSEILCSASLGSTTSANAAQYNMVDQVMELARSKLHDFEGFLHAGDNLRQQTLRQLQRILTTRQAARAFLLINDFSQLRNNFCRLAQNQEAKRKSRSEKKDIRIAIEYPADHCHSVVGNGALAFDTDYERWLDEHQHVINNLRMAFNSQMGDNDELRAAIVGVTSHYDELFRLKNIGTKADVFHMLSGTWKTPLERCFMWLAGFRSSELLKIVRNQLEPLTEQQLMGLYNLQQSSLQAEDALSQGMEALHQSLSEILSSASLGSTGSGNVAEHMGQIMALAMSKFATLECFLHQADLLRQQTLLQLQRILTVRQVANVFLIINDYVSRLRNVKPGSSPMIESKM